MLTCQYDENSTEHRYIVSDPQIRGGEPIISGSRTPVRAVVELWRTCIAPEEIPSDLPHLTAARVFDAPSYFSDNQAKIGAYIEVSRTELAEVRDPWRRAGVKAHPLVTVCFYRENHFPTTSEYLSGDAA